MDSIVSLIFTEKSEISLVWILLVCFRCPKKIFIHFDVHQLPLSKPAYIQPDYNKLTDDFDLNFFLLRPRSLQKK